MEKPQAKKKKTSTNSTNSKLNGTRSQGTKKTSAKKIDTVKKSVPSSTDSVAVYMRNSDKRSSLSGIANAAEKKYGKIDVSKLDITKPRKTNVAEARKKYNLK